MTPTLREAVETLRDEWRAKGANEAFTETARRTYRCRASDLDYILAAHPDAPPTKPFERHEDAIAHMRAGLLADGWTQADLDAIADCPSMRPDAPEPVTPPKRTAMELEEDLYLGKPDGA